MASGIDQAERERELTKQALASTLDRLESRVRRELDWKARLRRDGLRYALLGGAVLALGVGVVVAQKARAPKRAVAAAPATFDDLAAEVAAIRKRLDGAKVSPDGSPLWQKLALRGAAAAAGAAGTYAARRLMARAEEQHTPSTGA
ncbi:MAG: hypothetical protein ACYDAC_06620 [Candidatus Dormibacteria bacterium]